MYKVIAYFADLQDGSRPYEVGDTFPRPGLEVSDERLAELSGGGNMQGKPLIKKVKQSTKKTK